MADLLQRYGIKEVADVVFYEIADTGLPAAPVLALDSLKVTSIEQTAESTDARGGKGNAKLITWDYGKEITVTIEDALFSPKSLAIMFGEGKIGEENFSSETSTTDYGYILKSARVVAKTDGVVPDVYIDDKKVEPGDCVQDVYDTGIAIKGFKWYRASANQEAMVEITTPSGADFHKGNVYVARWYMPVKSKSIITLKPDSFPGAYYVTGDTMIRNETTLKDEYFQFIIPKAKMQTSQTIQMQADGDPSTFNMTLTVLRPDNGPMVKFVKYEFYDADEIPQVAPDIATTSDYDGWYDEIDLGITLTQSTTTTALPKSVKLTGNHTYKISSVTNPSTYSSVKVTSVTASQVISTTTPDFHITYTSGSYYYTASNESVVIKDITIPTTTTTTA